MHDQSHDHLWYKDAIIYETHVRAFYDSADDGIGDFCGLTAKLDYLHDLGITAIWLLPFYPSPLRDDGYDIADYTDIHPAYGTLDDFKTFLAEAHKRGLRVITELVLNHTSDQHPWFQRARHAAPGSPERNFYVWSDTPERYEDARVIFQDFEASNWSWDPLANAYYWHRFYSHQPDLNFNSPEVRAAILEAMDFWLELGVDGLRLDAVPYLFEQEGTTGENLPKTHMALRQLRQHIDAHYEHRMLLAEANQWPEDAVAYFGDGDECHMAFHFPLMPRLFMALRMEDRFPIIDIIEQTPEIPETAQWALFLRNHDELTLEMVTDEERLYMYRSYANNSEARINLGIRRRLAPLLNNNRRKIELMNGLLMALPGTPVLYYGDEIGMGDNMYLGDRDGVRTPMQWNADRNAGFSRANPQRLYLPLISDPEYHYESVHVEAQQENASSLLWWMKRLIALRKRYLAFGRGSITFLDPRNRKVLAFIREFEDERILVVTNLSRFAQHVELDLAAFDGQTPVELFGRTRFPSIGELPYLLTLGPHTFYWFALEPQAVPTRDADDGTMALPVITVAQRWEQVITGDGRAALEEVLMAYLPTQSWFPGKIQTILSTRIEEAIRVPMQSDTAYLLLVEVEYADSEPNRVLLPLTCAADERAQHLRDEHPQAVVARLHIASDEQATPRVLYDALWSEALPEALLCSIFEQKQFKGSSGMLGGSMLDEAARVPEQIAPAEAFQGDRNNAIVLYGQEHVLKIFRAIGDGTNPELEIGHFLNDKQFAHTLPVLGALEYHSAAGVPMTLAILEGFVPNQGVAWQMVQDALHTFFAHTQHASATDTAELDQPDGWHAADLLYIAEQTPPPILGEFAGESFARARLLGQRTAEMHIALAGDDQNLAFAPEPFTSLYQRSLYQSMRSLAGRVAFILQHDQERLPENARADAQHVRAHHAALLARFKAVTSDKIDAQRIRCHGNYHLGQVLFTGDDFVIFDFEGEPSRPVIERQLKHSPLRDVAHMLRSFDQAALKALHEHLQHNDLGEDGAAGAERWAAAWSRWASAAFLGGYRAATRDWPILPDEDAHVALLLDVFVLEKAVIDLGYAIDYTPEVAGLPLKNVLALLHEDAVVT